MERYLPSLGEPLPDSARLDDPLKRPEPIAVRTRPTLVWETTKAFRFAIICVLAAAVAFAFQLHRMPATYAGGELVPSDNDAFYHARRILDTAENPAAFYEFDPHIHAPYGSLVVWPWGYDYGVATIVRAATSLGITSDPMVALAYVPPFAVILAIALVTILAWNVGLSAWATALLAFSIAVSPLTQVMHGIACVDHHFAEYLFILGFLAAATGWLKRPDSAIWAVSTGLVLGLAPAIHTLLFVLQVPLLLCLALLWLRKDTISPTTAGLLCLALLVGTCFVAALSQPLQEGYFEHYYLSWFHVYVACCSVLVIAFVSRRPSNRRNFLLLCGISSVLALPLVAQVVQAAGYLGNTSTVLTHIGEAHSFWQRFHDNPSRTIQLYSGLALTAPLIVFACLYSIWRVRKPELLLVLIYSILAIPLLLAQFRFHYYGSISLTLPILLLADWLSRKRPRGLVAAAMITVAFVLAQGPSLRMAIASETVVGRDPYFRLTRLAMPALAAACSTDPGIVLAKSNEGHFIRYYTECSVIANNFLLTNQQIEAFKSGVELFSRKPEELVDGRIPIKYVLVRARGSIATSADGSNYMIVDKEDAALVSDPLTDALLWSDPASVPASFELITEIAAPGKDYPYARLWKINRPGD
jgi:hypothetical protein